MITFFDLCAKDSIKCWSPYALRARYVLNLKKLPYQTRWLDYPDLKPASIEAGIPPYSTWQNGEPYYTCPAIIDDVTETAIPDSFKIALYLDKQYPDTPKAIPPGIEALQASFEEHFMDLLNPVWVLIVHKVPSFLNSNSAKYFYDTRSAFFGKPLEQLASDPESRKELWAKLQGNFDKLDAHYRKTEGPLFMGETVSFADFVVAGVLQTIRTCLGKDYTEWKAMEKWNGGRWKTLLENLEPYASEEN